MSDGFALRVADPDDTDAIEQLGQRSADGGAVSYRVRTHARPGSGTGLTRSSGVVAVSEGDGQIIGSARTTLGLCRYEGAERPYALLGSLVVHPQHRRRGIAAALARWRIEQAAQTAGPDVVVLADIQHGNTGSMAAARRWATAFAGPSLIVPVTMRGRAPRRPRGMAMRAATRDQLPEVAAGVTQATAEVNFARIWTAETLERWLQWAPTGAPIHHYRVAVSPSGVVLAGIALRQESLLRTMEVLRMPPAVRLANAVLHAVPRDGVLRNLAVEHLWHLPGQHRAAIELWNDTRWTFRRHGSNLLIALDRRSPLLPLVGVRPWTPRTSLTTAVRADPPPSGRRLVAPPE